MAASHFFVGLGAGLALLTLPVLALAPGGIDVPGRIAAWVNGPEPGTVRSASAAPAVTRPVRGFVPGEPTPGAASPPATLAAVRAEPTRLAMGVQQTAQGGPLPTAVVPTSGMRTGVIRSGGAPVPVRRAAGIESPGDPTLADGSPVLVSLGNGLTIGGQAWRAVRGLNGIVGWILSVQVSIDGEAPVAQQPALQATAQATQGPASERATIANTGGVGVVLRRSAQDVDRLPTGLVDGTQVTVLERQGSDWARVRADNGREGWVPARYLAP